jgi:hypothetical protein
MSVPLTASEEKKADSVISLRRGQLKRARTAAPQLYWRKYAAGYRHAPKPDSPNSNKRLYSEQQARVWKAYDKIPRTAYLKHPQVAVEDQPATLRDGFVVGPDDNLYLFYRCIPKTKLNAICSARGISTRLPLSIKIGLLVNTPAQGVKLADSLALLGVPKDQFPNVNPCLKSAIESGLISFGDPNFKTQVVHKGPCFNCSAEITCTLEDTIFQPALGTDYTEGGTNAAVKCPQCGIGNYLSRLCVAQPSTLYVFLIMID